jgi:hypothetical protein
MRKHPRGRQICLSRHLPNPAYVSCLSQQHCRAAYLALHSFSEVNSGSYPPLLKLYAMPWRPHDGDCTSSSMHVASHSCSCAGTTYVVPCMSCVHVHVCIHTCTHSHRCVSLHTHLTRSHSDVAAATFGRSLQYCSTAGLVVLSTMQRCILAINHTEQAKQPAAIK